MSTSGRRACAAQTLRTTAFGALGNGYPDEGDNEITGIYMSDGDASVGGVLGAKEPLPFHDGWRLFWTQQHGDNVTWEVLPANRVTGDDN